MSQRKVVILPVSAAGASSLPLSKRFASTGQQKNQQQPRRQVSLALQRRGGQNAPKAANKVVLQRAPQQRQQAQKVRANAGRNAQINARRAGQQQQGQQQQARGQPRVVLTGSGVLKAQKKQRRRKLAAGGDGGNAVQKQQPQGNKQSNGGQRQPKQQQQQRQQQQQQQQGKGGAPAAASRKNKKIRRGRGPAAAPAAVDTHAAALQPPKPVQVPVTTADLDFEMEAYK